MGFVVTASYGIAGDWEDTDRRLYEAAGRRSDKGSVTNGIREHLWRVADLHEARAVRAVLANLPGVTARVREE